MNIEDIEKYSQKKINKILFDYEVKTIGLILEEKQKFILNQKHLMI